MVRTKEQIREELKKRIERAKEEAVAMDRRIEDKFGNMTEEEFQAYIEEQNARAEARFALWAEESREAGRDVVRYDPPLCYRYALEETDVEEN